MIVYPRENFIYKEEMLQLYVMRYDRPCPGVEIGFVMHACNIAVYRL
jgi:hypothetical protein